MRSRGVVVFLCWWMAGFTYALNTPEVNPHLPQFIIGYGSLMQEHSKRQSAQQVGPNYPVMVKHFERAWCVWGKRRGLNTTYLGVRPNKARQFNAVYYQVAAKDLPTYDKRERHYQRVNVGLQDLQALTKKPLPDGQYWLYVVRKARQPPHQNYPILQSYVDIFLAGCLELQARFHLPHFARQCITSTNNWHNSWVNDRACKAEPRMASLYTQRRVDKLLQTYLPVLFKHIKPLNKA